MRRVAGATCLALLTAATGCHEPFSNEDVLFLKSLPRDVGFDVPGGDGQRGRGLTPAQSEMQENVAKFYRDMVATSTATNDQIFQVLRYVETLTSSAATVREDDRRAWGPLRPKPEDPFELLLVVDHVFTATVVTYTSQSEPFPTDSVFRFALSGRPGEKRDFTQFLYGESVVLSAASDEAYGYFCFDLDAVHALDPTSQGSGTYCASYDFRGTQETVELSVKIAGDLYVNPDAAFSLHREASGAGRFFFSMRGNVFGDPEVPEISSVTVRWNETLAARADSSTCGGDAPYPLFAAECWDDAFLRTFLLSNIPGFPAVGSLELCPGEFQEPDALAQPCSE